MDLLSRNNIILLVSLGTLGFTYKTSTLTNLSVFTQYVSKIVNERRQVCLYRYRYKYQMFL